MKIISNQLQFDIQNNCDKSCDILCNTRITHLHLYFEK